MKLNLDQLMRSSSVKAPDDFSDRLMQAVLIAPPPRFRRYDLKKIRKLALLITGLLGIMFACPAF